MDRSFLSENLETTAGATQYSSPFLGVLLFRPGYIYAVVKIPTSRRRWTWLGTNIARCDSVSGCVRRDPSYIVQCQAFILCRTVLGVAHYWRRTIFLEPVLDPFVRLHRLSGANDQARDVLIRAA